MKKILLSTLTFLSIISCNNKEEPSPNQFVQVFPRQCKHALVSFAKRTIVEYNGYTGYTIEDLSGTSALAKDLYLIIYTSSIDDFFTDYTFSPSGPCGYQQTLDRQLQDLDENNYGLDEQLKDDYI